MKNLFSHIKQPFSNWRRRDWLVALIMLLVTSAISTPMFIQRINVPKNSDYLDHIRFTLYLLSHQYEEISPMVIAHPGYQILLAGIYWLAFHTHWISLPTAATSLEVAGLLLLVLIIYLWLGGAEKKYWNLYRAIWAITLVFVAPIMFFVFWDHLYYLGYIGISNYHNPTVNLLKPVALASFICALRIFSNSTNSVRVIILSAFLTILSALIKPNYLICILPALGIMALLFLVLRRKIDWRMLVLGFFLPGVLILSAQWIIAYYIPGGDNEIIFSPLGVLSIYSRYLLPKLFFSILFPLTVLVFYFRKATHDPELQLAWLGFLISLIPSYFLAEKAHFASGNLLWSSQIMLLILFVASARCFLRERIAINFAPLRQKVIIYIAYAAHIIAGVAFYVYAIRLSSGYPS